MVYPITGECQCGQVSYVLHKAPLKVLTCHCTECQKLATGPFSVTAVVASESIEFFGDLKEWRRTSESGNINIAMFCPNCGNRIYHLNPDEPSLIKLKLKPVNFEDDTIFAPKIHIWTQEKLSWFDLPENIESHPKGMKK